MNEVEKVMFDIYNQKLAILNCGISTNTRLYSRYNESATIYLLGW